MITKFLKVFFLLCLIGNILNAQDKPAYKPFKKPGMLSYSINYSDYGFVKTLRDSSFNAAINRKGLFKSGNSSFGFGLSYWKGLGSHIDFSFGLNGTFSNFPALFVKGDSVGKASFTPQLDALLHIKAFKESAFINPFLTGGIGAGYFGKQLAVYTPVGTGLQFKFNKGAYLQVQAQWRMALTDGINDDYMFYSLGFSQSPKAKVIKKKPEPKVVTPALVDTAVKKNIVAGEPDTDGDGIPDLRDECPNDKGTVRGCPDSDGDGIPDKNDKCPNVKGDARYQGCPVPDSDGDGINDDDDKCKTVPGTKENMGCPSAKDATNAVDNGDDDGDGVINKNDKCPTVPGTKANAGCPIKTAEGGKILRSTDGSVTYYIRFDLDRSILTNEAFATMKDLVNILKVDNSLKIQIDGHADNLGTEKYNMQLSSERANIAKKYFLSYGIAESRITTAFFGSSKPYDVNQEWLNRRVEITISK